MDADNPALGVKIARRNTCCVLCLSQGLLIRLSQVAVNQT